MREVGGEALERRSLLWVTGIAVFPQTVFNTGLVRYTLATGEPAFTGFMRTRPSAPRVAGVGRLSSERVIRF